MLKILMRLCVAVITLAVVAGARSADMRDIRGSMDLLKGAQEIRQEYLLPMRLEGRSMRYALDLMLSEGFLCGIKKDMPSVLPPPNDVPPFLACSKDHAQLNAKCDGVIISILPERSQRSEADDPLLLRLGSTSVHGVTPFCPRTFKLREEELNVLVRKREIAEIELSSSAEGLAFVGSVAEDAFMKLLALGYSCGLELSRPASESGVEPLLHCTRRNSKIEGCLREVLRINVAWPRKEKELASYLPAMHSAAVRSLKASCDIPTS